MKKESSIHVESHVGNRCKLAKSDSRQRLEDFDQIEKRRRSFELAFNYIKQKQREETLHTVDNNRASFLAVYENLPLILNKCRHILHNIYTYSV